MEMAVWQLQYKALVSSLIDYSQYFVEKESSKELHPIVYLRTDLAAVGGIVGEKPPISQYLPSEVVDGDLWIQSPRSNVE